jgi:hypothetical protein
MSEANKISKVTAEEFLQVIDLLPVTILSTLSRYSIDEAQEYSFYLSADKQAGYGIKLDGELINLFSLEHGRGTLALKHAIEHGANHLNCFDTFLPAFYLKHGFVEHKRGANWTVGQPDVVYMRRS